MLIYTDVPRHRAGRPNRTSGCKGVHLWRWNGRSVPRISISLWCEDSGTRHLVQVLCPQGTVLRDAITACETVKSQADRRRIRDAVELEVLVRRMKCWLRSRAGSGNGGGRP